VSEGPATTTSADIAVPDTTIESNAPPAMTLQDIAVDGMP